MKAASIVKVIINYAGYPGHSVSRLAMPSAASSSFKPIETRGFIGLGQYNPPIKISNPYYDAMINLARESVRQLHEGIDCSRLSVNERYEVAKIAAAQDGGGTSEYIGNYGLTDQSQLFEIAKIAAARDGWGTSEYIRNYELDQGQRFEIAKIAAAQDGRGTSANIDKYFLYSSQRYEIAKIAAAQDGEGTYKYIGNYGLIDWNQLFEIATIAAAQSGFIGLGQYNTIIKISNPYYDAMIDLARKDVKKLHQIIDISRLSVDERFEIAKIAAAQDGTGTSAYMDEYSLLYPSQQYEVARIAAAQDGRGTSAQIDKYVLYSFQQYEVAKIAILSDIHSFRSMANYYLLGIDNFETEREFGREEFTVYVREQLTNLGLNPALADCLYGDMQNREVGMKLFLLLVEAAEQGELAAVPEPKSTNITRYLLAKYTGLDPTLLYGQKFSRNDISSLYLLGLSLQQGMPNKVFEKIKFSPELFRGKSQKQLLAFLRLLERVKNILGAEAPLRFTEFMDQYAEMIGPANIEKLTSQVEDSFLRLFKKFFKISNESITMEKIEALEKKWGDLDVFYTLAAEYNSISYWRKELPVLSKIVKNVLEGTFHQMKYQGDPADKKDQTQAAAQLAMLKEDGRKAWQADYSRLSVFNTSAQTGTVSEAELLSRSKARLKDQVAGHVEEFMKGSRPDREKIDELKTKIGNAPKYETIKKEDRAATLIACLELLNEAQDIRRYKSILGLLASAKDYFKFDAQITADLKELADLLKYKETGSEAIVFTTTTDDPKLLLMTGALVDASSCQDYRHGSHIGSLPGYVIDAGAKLILSYALREKDFASRQEYEKAKILIGKGILPEFIPAKQILKIGEFEIQLPKAMIRRVVKLGRTDNGGARIMVERPYSQNHFAESEMGEQIGSVIDEIASKTGAKRYGKITFPASRNPGGIYSDAGGGTKIGEYSVSI